ncbi:MAG: zinc dependent phospholipase C family protein [Candidatus Thorarchaeota archaeon]
MKEKYYTIIFAVLFVLCTGSCEPTLAWKNGQNIALTWQNVRGDYEITHYYTTTSKYYGTHDWVAERALKLVVERFPENKFLEMIYLNVGQMKYYYLLGTEVPDTIDSNSFLPVNTGLNLIQVEKNFYSTHGIKIENDAMVRKTCAKAANFAALRISYYLNEGDFKAAALILGAVTHYIADATFIPHLNSLGSAHQTHDLVWKYWVNTLTSRKIADEYYCEGKITSELPFFYYDTARTEFNYHLPSLDAYTAVWWAGMDTWLGHPMGVEAGCGFQGGNYPDFMWYRDHPNFPKAHFTGPERRADYWLDLAEGDEDDNDFLEGIYHHLNVAVYYSAAFLNFAKDWYVKCSEEAEKELVQTVVNVAFEYLFLYMMAATGMFSTVLVLTGSLLEKKELAVITVK